MGGAIALSIAVARPEAVRQLVLVVHGRDDRVVPWRRSSAQLLDLLPDARLYVLSGCRHWTMIERTDDFLAVVEPFLAS
jgi:pimeloyl-ACP methyl ester carboxylesterase